MRIENARPVIQMDLQGNFIKEYPSIKNAAKQFGGTERAKSLITKACMLKHENGANSLRNIAHNFKWKYAN